MWAWPSQPLPFSAGTHLKEHLGLWHPIVRVGPAQDVRGVQGEGGFLPAVGVGHDAGTTSVQLCLTCHSCHTRGLHVTACHTRGLHVTVCHTRGLTCHSVTQAPYMSQLVTQGPYMSQRVTQGAYMSEEAVHYLVHRLVAALQSWEENPEQQRGNTVGPRSPPHTPITYSSWKCRISSILPKMMGATSLMSFPPTTPSTTPSMMGWR